MTRKTRGKNEREKPFCSFPEMFEHMKNYGLLLEKLSGWLNANGKLFVHIFTHRNYAYHFEKGDYKNLLQLLCLFGGNCT